MYEGSNRPPIGLLTMALAVIFAAATVAGCNTVEGAGEDIEAAGEAIGETARDVEEDLN